MTFQSIYGPGSWHHLFTFNRDSIKLYNMGCDHNMPADVTIPPRKSIKFFAVLTFYREPLHVGYIPNFKIGFIDHHSPKVCKHSLYEKTYWSNDVEPRTKTGRWETDFE